LANALQSGSGDNSTNTFDGTQPFNWLSTLRMWLLIHQTMVACNRWSNSFSGPKVA
jgi:hypothetical protein